MDDDDGEEATPVVYSPPATKAAPLLVVGGRDKPPALPLVTVPPARLLPRSPASAGSAEGDGLPRPREPRGEGAAPKREKRGTSSRKLVGEATASPSGRKLLGEATASPSGRKLGEEKSSRRLGGDAPPTLPGGSPEGGKRG